MQSVTQRSVTSSQVSEWSWQPACPDNIHQCPPQLHQDGDQDAGARQGGLCHGQLWLRVHHGGWQGGLDEGRGDPPPPLENKQRLVAGMSLKHKCLNSLIHTFYWSRIKSGLAWCQVFKRQFLMRGPWFTSALSRVFSNLERAPSREEQLNWYFHFPRASKNLMTWPVSSCAAPVTGHVTMSSSMSSRYPGLATQTGKWRHHYDPMLWPAPPLMWVWTVSPALCQL